MKKLLPFKFLVLSLVFVFLTTTFIPLEKISATQSTQKSVISLNTSDWKLQSSVVDTTSGSLISARTFSPAAWYTITVPCTVLAGLLQANYFGQNSG